MEAGLTQAEIKLIAGILELQGEQVTLTYFDEDGVLQDLEGAFRHIVAPTNVGFPQRITMDCRVRITSGFEFFVPLSDVYSFRGVEEPGKRVEAFG